MPKLKRKPKPRFLVIDGCPVPYDVAPYVWLVLRACGQRASSIYRGEDAKAILHRNGKRTQAEIHADPALRAISNPAGRSQHELRSDGVGDPGPPGRKLEEWQVGVDSGTDSQSDRAARNMAAAKYGLRIRHPYSAGVERHHWCFAERPKARKRDIARVIWLRAHLPRG